MGVSYNDEAFLGRFMFYLSYNDLFISKTSA